MSASLIGNPRSPVVPLLLSVAATVVYLLTLTSKEKELTKSYESVTVLAAAVDLPVRTRLEPSFVKTVSIPRRFVSPDAIEIRVASDAHMIKNLVTRTRIPKGTQLSQSALTSISPDSGLSVKVPPGYRGATVPVDKPLMALIKPGDRVDIVVGLDVNTVEGRREKATVTILQNLLVLGVGRDLGQGKTAKRFQEDEKEDLRSEAFSESGHLSLALNPLEFQYLALAREQGRIFVAVRGLGDIEMHPVPMARWKNLFGP